MRLKGFHDIKGFRDIRTNSTLARKGRLVSVAKNLRGNMSHLKGWDSSNWNIDQHIYKKKSTANTSTAIPLLESEVRLYLIRMTQDLLEELLQAVSKELDVAPEELNRVKARLAKLRAE